MYGPVGHHPPLHERVQHVPHLSRRRADGASFEQGFEQGFHGTYVKRYHDAEGLLGRGVNLYTLVWDGERWWIMAAAWDEEDGAGAIPVGYLP